jgi:uncharacterized protein
VFDEFIRNVQHNLFKPLLLFFYMGFSIPLLRVHFEFPHVLYQGITMYLLIAIGWHGGEELASLSAQAFGQAAGFMVVGFVTNTVIGFVAFLLLRAFTRMRRIDAATVAGYYGSDSAGTFLTCMGVLTGLQAAAEKLGNSEMLEAYMPAAYMPVMLAVMEIPGCLVALFLVSMYRSHGMDAEGNLPEEPGYKKQQLAEPTVDVEEPALATAAASVGTRHWGATTAVRPAAQITRSDGNGTGDNGHGEHNGPQRPSRGKKRGGFLSPKVLHEIFFNPGLFLLFGGILIGYLSRLQGTAVTEKNDRLFLWMFDGLLCLFLLEMGITACKRLKDLRTAGWGFIAFGVLAPNLFATIGIVVAHAYSHAIDQPFSIGTYTLFAVLCGASSYIAVPAVQRLAIPEASPTLPLAASLGLTFSYNVTIGIPVYIEIAKAIDRAWPVLGTPIA